MGLTIEDAVKLIVHTVSKGIKHKDYDRVTNLADEYKTLITGEGIDKMLKRIIKREDEEAFKQRIEITQTVLPAVSERIISPFSKIARMDNVTKTMEFVTDSDGVKKKNLERTLKKFWGDEDLDAYMRTRFVELSFADPNSFILVEFNNDFNSDIERPQPFPVEVSSHDVLNFKYENNSLEWIVFRRKVVIEKPDPQDSKKTMWVEEYEYVIYLDDYQVQLRRIDEKAQGVSSSIPLDEKGKIVKSFKIKADEKNKFQVDIFNPKTGMVQGIRVGYKRDLETDGRTCVSPLHTAVNRMKKTLKTGSEFDLTMTLHAFPQKWQYVQPCPGESDKKCRGGEDVDGNTCKACNGSGLVLHTSAQDSVLLPMPKNKDDIYDLSKLTHYSGPDISLAKFQEEYAARLEYQAVRDVFNSETFEKNTGPKTATEITYDFEGVNDTLFPFGVKFSAVYEKLVFISAIFTSNSSGLMVVHAFPKDLKLKTLKTLLSDLKTASESNAPAFVRTQIASDIAEKIWADNPEKLRVFKVKQQHIPFDGKSNEEIMFVMAQGNAARHDIVLWSNFEAIFRELELEHVEDGKDFFALSYKSRVEKIQKKVEEFEDRINGTTSTATTFGGSSAEVEPPSDVEAEARAKLRGTVGGVNSVIETNRAVAAGEITEESAINMLMIFFGYTREEADSMIDKTEPQLPITE